MNKWNVLYWYNKIFVNEKEYDNMDGQKHYANWKKPFTKVHIFYNSIKWNVHIGRFIDTESRLSDCF